ncbi:hypothetical protein HaLaN_16259, partial [Haematococcus lacustris]
MPNASTHLETWWFPLQRRMELLPLRAGRWESNKVDFDAAKDHCGCQASGCGKKQ